MRLKWVTTIKIFELWVENVCPLQPYVYFFLGKWKENPSFRGDIILCVILDLNDCVNVKKL